jgi:hypothetical protein
MKHATEADYVAAVDDAGVHVIFKPTESHYDYDILADGGLSREYHVRHAQPGGIGDYVESEVEAMAYEVAKEAYRRSRQQRS